MTDRMDLLEDLQSQVATHTCPECQKPTYCAMEAGKSANTCWCMAVQVNRPMSMCDGCLCRDCLEDGE